MAHHWSGIVDCNLELLCVKMIFNGELFMQTAQYLIAVQEKLPRKPLTKAVGVNLIYGSDEMHLTRRQLSGQDFDEWLGDGWFAH